MNPRSAPAALGFLLLSVVLLHAQAPQGQIVSGGKIWDKAGHNSTPDVTRFQNLFYCCLREADSATSEGTIRILLSSTGKTWVAWPTWNEEAVTAPPGIA